MSLPDPKTNSVHVPREEKGFGSRKTVPCVPGAAEGCLSLKSRAQPEKCLATTNSTSLLSTSALGAHIQCFTHSLQATQASFPATGQLRPHKLILSHPPPSLLSPSRAFLAAPCAKPHHSLGLSSSTVIHSPSRPRKLFFVQFYWKLTDFSSGIDNDIFIMAV